jgi:hypothetical protein
MTWTQRECVRKSPPYSPQATTSAGPRHFTTTIAASRNRASGRFVARGHEPSKTPATTKQFSKHQAPPLDQPVTHIGVGDQ